MPTDQINVALSSDDLTALIGVIVNARRTFRMSEQDDKTLGNLEELFHRDLKALGYESHMRTGVVHAD